MDIITGVAFPLKTKNCFKTQKGNLNIEISKKLNFIYLSQFNYIPNCSLIEYISNSNNSEYINENLDYIFELLKSVGLFKELDLKDQINYFKHYLKMLYQWRTSPKVEYS